MPEDFEQRDPFPTAHGSGDYPPPGVDPYRWNKWNRRWRRRSTAPHAAGAIVLIAIGVLLFLSSTGLLPIRNVWDFWPLVFTIVGISKLINCRTAAGSIWAILLIGFGVLCTAITTGLLYIPMQNGRWPLGLLLIALGLFGLMQAQENRSRRRFVGLASPALGGFPPSSPPRSAPTGPPQDTVNENVVFSGAKRVVNSPQFQGGEVHAVFGSVELDLRYAQITPTSPSTVLQIECVFGNVEICVPHTCKVEVQASQVLASV
jgi:predicted membrane protein